ncbi:NifB/NifX family molybdenum-iron cluster-binding protein [Defluviicoccus vanus]|uniref:Dinitrogenase iron-molybdenum cofactor biosynthesis domain-containing protein n=1 Tax=Defluviicoccus vanus TaxID=111831 RepID=A0A7H1N3K1_9PROT|nr:NifB/NifX family molybdenum-iron cluster-binding protein [Defluviicoccus vanus]QNT70287.1 hypothetical protein HQ394_14305 [Defluviicoccus vanus]
MTVAHQTERRLRVVCDGEQAAVLRIAIATRNNELADVPFGRTPMFAVYEVGLDASSLRELIEFAVPPHRCAADNDNPDDCEGRLDARIAALAGCQVLFARCIGEAATAAAMKAHIHPIELARNETVVALLRRCQAMLATNPPPWLRRAVGSPGAIAGARNGTELAGGVRRGADPLSVTATAVGGR